MDRAAARRRPARCEARRHGAVLRQPVDRGHDAALEGLEEIHGSKPRAVRGPISGKRRWPGSPRGRGRKRAPNANRSDVKQSAVFQKRVAIGHPGNIVGNASQPPVDGRAVKIAPPFLGHQVRVGCKPREEIPHDAVGLLPNRRDGPVPVHVGEEEALDVGIGLTHGGREGHHCLGRLADRIGVGRSERREATLAFADHVLDEPGDDPPAEFVNDAAALQPGPRALNFVQQLTDERHPRRDSSVKRPARSPSSMSWAS